MEVIFLSEMEGVYLEALVIAGESTNGGPRGSEECIHRGPRLTNFWKVTANSMRFIL